MPYRVRASGQFSPLRLGGRLYLPGDDVEPSAADLARPEVRRLLEEVIAPPPPAAPVAPPPKVEAGDDRLPDLG